MIEYPENIVPDMKEFDKGMRKVKKIEENKDFDYFMYLDYMREKSEPTLMEYVEQMLSGL